MVSLFFILILFLLFTYVTICMKLDPGIHIVMHLVCLLKTGCDTHSLLRPNNPSSSPETHPTSLRSRVSDPSSRNSASLEGLRPLEPKLRLARGPPTPLAETPPRSRVSDPSSRNSASLEGLRSRERISASLKGLRSPKRTVSLTPQKTLNAQIRCRIPKSTKQDAPMPLAVGGLTPSLYGRLRSS